jgi:cellulose synthase (UDP-forming)
MPGESEIFYRIVQHGLDAWHSSFFCGSAAILRRRHLDEIGGLSGETVTEDAETALRLHAKGYKSAYVGKPMVLGLQPETFTGFIGQRCRWAQGMVTRA